MTERIEERLTDALTRHAGSVTTTRIASDEVVVAGRAARHRRRVAAVSTIAAGITAAAVAVGVLTATGRPDSASPPGNPHSPSPTPSASASVQSGVTAAQLGLYVVSRNIIVRPDGSRVTLPFGDGVGDVVQAKNGWVVLVGAADGRSLWYVPDSGQPTRIGGIGGNFMVSGDGTVLVATGVNGPSNVDAYRLPSLERIRRTTFDSGMGPNVAGIVGDRVLLNGAQGSPGASDVAVWNLRTGTLRPTPVAVWIWGVARDGRVLRHVTRFVPGGSKEQLNSCVDVVTLTDTLPTGDTGYCDRQWNPVTGGSLSPNGDWAVVAILGESHNYVRLVRAADLHDKGQLSAAPMQLPGRTIPLFWDTDESYIAASPVDEGQHVRCTTTGTCTPIVTSSDLPVQRLLPPMN
jgi:hypothetical protein